MTTTRPDDFEHGIFEARQYMIGTPGVDARFVVDAAEHRRQLEEHRKALALAVAAVGGEIRIPRRLAVELDHFYLSEEWMTNEWILRYKPSVSASPSAYTEPKEDANDAS